MKKHFWVRWSMIRYGKGKKANAIKVVSRVEQNGNVTVKEKIEIQVNYLGDMITMVGWNGQTRTRTFKSRNWSKKLRYINNKGMGYAILPETTTTQPSTTILL